MAIEFKRDPYVAGFAVVVVLCATFLVWHGDVTLKEAAAVVTAALFGPAIFGRKDDEDEDEDEEKAPDTKDEKKKDPS